MGSLTAWKSSPKTLLLHGFDKNSWIDTRAGNDLDGGGAGRGRGAAIVGAATGERFLATTKGVI